MQFEVNDLICGFTVTRVRPSAELGGRLVEMSHRKTGARLCWLDNGAENKVFSIAFRTLPTDDTGVFHILEHSVLCGSARFPVREPFVELLKGSMNTFLNAMTFPDMTMYPVGSRNDQDLLNLTEVYLDAVFAPRMLTDERVFRQEGWRIEPDDEGEMVYSGVVFNEMKGAMSDVREVGETAMARMLFPDTGYGYNSGGEPDRIPTLTYGQFCDTYRRHYHPSNAWIYLDGAAPMERLLPLIASYLDRYEAEADLPAFTFQTPVSARREVFYELGQEEEAQNRGHLYLSRIFGTWRDKARNMAVSVLGDVLTGNNESPLKRLILEKGLAQDFSLSVDDSALQSTVTLHAENVTDGREAEILEAVSAFADRLEAEGLDQEAVEASLNRFAFSLKEDEEPQGIERAVLVMGSWLYDGDPLFALENDREVAQVRRMLDSGEMLALALDVLRGQEGRCELRLKPSKTLGEETRRREEARLAEITGAWSEADRAANDGMLERLRAWQETPDSPEALATLPMLKKEDADLPPLWPETETLRAEGVPLLYHPIPCGGIDHIRAYFNLSALEAEELQDVSLICAMLGKLPTAGHDASSLQREIKRYTGRLGVTVSVWPDPEDPERCVPTLCAFVSTLKEGDYTLRGQALLAEVLKTTDFSDTGKIVEIVQQLEMMSRMRIVSAGHVIGIRAALAHYSSEMALRNALEGDEAVRYLHRFATDPDSMLPRLRRTAEKLMREVTVRQRMTLSLTADAPLSDWTPLMRDIPEGEAGPSSMKYAVSAALRQGYRIPAQVGFAVRGWHLKESEEAYRPQLFLAANILTYSYLWNQVRVQGGAYGCGFQADRFGNLFSYSYRDPTPGRTLGVDAGAADFLRAFAAEGGEDGELDKFIISTLNDLNPLISPRERGALADARIFGGYTRAQAEDTRKKILYATPADLRSIAGLLEAFADRGAVCVVAPEDALEKCPDLEIGEL